MTGPMRSTLSMRRHSEGGICQTAFASYEQKIAEDKKELTATIEEKECEQLKLSLNDKQKLRADEIEAMGKASEIVFWR